MSRVSSATGTSATGTLGDAPPVSFPGIASGIDYNSIIQKYTAATLLQQDPIKTSVNNLNAANAEILKIQSLVGSVQDSLKAVSALSTFQAYSATSSVAGVATFTQIANTNALPGPYTINSQTAATSTQIVNHGSVANAGFNPAAILAASGASVSPSNGNSAVGKLTINGQQITYDVNVDSLNSIIAKINALTGVTASYVGGVFTLQSTGGTGLTIGSGGDSGNLASVLKIDSSAITPIGGGNQQVLNSSPLGGLNYTATLNSAGNAGFATAVSAGTFTINGVQFTVDPTKDALSDIVKRINASTAGVTASYDAASSKLTLTNTTPGPQSILVGATGDTSNFLTAAALTLGSGAATTVGTQASVNYTNAAGVVTTAYSSTNSFNSIIPGFTLKVTSTTTTPYTATIASDPTVAEKAIGTFVTAYNAALDELNRATAAPTYISSTSTSTGKQQTDAATAGGPLFNSFQITSLRDTLVRQVSGFFASGSTSYNSLASVGLALDTASVSDGSVTKDDSTSTTASSATSGTISATSGKLAALDTAKFEAALAAQPSAVQAIFTSATGLANQLGGFLSQQTGLPTILDTGIAGPTRSTGVITAGDVQAAYSQSIYGGISVLQALLDSNTQTIKSDNKEIQLISTLASQQADRLRTQFSNSEVLIAQYQALQGTISSIGH